MKHLARLFIGLAVVLLAYATLAVVATFSQLADAADRVYAGAGTPVFWGLVVVFTGLACWPLVVMWRLPKMKTPPVDTSEPGFSEHKSWLRKHLSQHPNPQVQTLAVRDDIEGALAILEAEAHQLIKSTAGGVFVSTALIQNGRLDGLLMLGMQLKLVWQLASLYGLRPTPRQLTYLYGNVAGTMLLASQLDDIDFAELASPIVASVAPSLAGAAPGMQGIGQLLVNSMASGSANAFLTLRVGLIAQAYCAPRVQPVKGELRVQATREALSLLAGITREQGTRVAQGVWRGIKSGATQTIQTIAQGSQKMAQQATAAVRNTVDSAVDFTGQSLKKTAQTATGAASQVVKTTAKAGSAVASSATQVGQTVLNAAGQATGKLTDTVSDGAQTLTQVGRSTMAATGKLFRRGEKDASPDGRPAGKQGELL